VVHKFGRNVWVSSLVDAFGSTSANEVCATTIPMPFGTEDVLFATYNAPRGPGMGGHARARSLDGGATWEVAAGSAVFPAITESVSPFQTSTDWVGDTWCTAVGPAGVVAVVAVVGVTARGASDTRPTDVALWVSTNAGDTFPFAVPVSDLFSSGVDGPKVAADEENGSVWIWWYNRVAGVQKNWLRRFDIGSDGRPTAAGPPLSLTDILVDVTPEWQKAWGLPPILVPALPVTTHAVLAVHSKGRGRKPRLFLCWASNADGAFDDRDANTPGCLTQPNDRPAVRWYMAYSDDEGLTWTTTLVDEDPAWPHCISPNRLTANRPTPSMVFDKRSERLFITLNSSAFREDGAFVGTRARLYAWPARESDGEFDVWTPLCNPAASEPSAFPTIPPDVLPVLPAGAADAVLEAELQWRKRLPTDETYCFQYGGSVGQARRGDPRVAWMWYDSRDSKLSHPRPGDRAVVQLEANVWAAVLDPRRTPPPLARAQVRITPLANGAQAGVTSGPGGKRRYAPVVAAATGSARGHVPWNPSRAGYGNVWWGDYSNGVTWQGDHFFGFWADMRDRADSSRIYGAAFRG